MRISFILSSLRLSGGVRVVVQYANRLSRRGHEISLIIPDGTVDPQITSEIDQDIHIITTKHKLLSKPNILNLLRTTWEMAIVVPKSDFIIATHTPTTAVSFIAGKILRRGKNLWFYQDYPEMFENRPIERWLLRNAASWHILSLTVSEACVQEMLSFHKSAVINVGEGLDTVHLFYPRQNTLRDKYKVTDNKVILFLGDSRPRKGMADYITAVEKAFKDIPEIVMWIASKEKITLQTPVPYKLFFRPTDEELAGLYSACDVFISSSWYEGFGLPPLEAMACGAAVITTDSRGINEYAIDGENCIVVPPKNPEVLARTLISLLADHKLMKRLKANGPITAVKFDWVKATDRFETALQSVLD